MSATTWVALLRGINVGRNQRVAMADLRALFEGLGHEEVRTLLQSGNAVFRTGGGTAAELEQQITARIKADLGLDVAVIARSAKQLATVVAENPFVARGVDPKQLHVSFLSAAPPAEPLKALDRESFAPDEFEVGSKVIYERRPNGVLASRLPDWPKVLGLMVTARNWRTVTRLHDLASG